MHGHRHLRVVGVVVAVSLLFLGACGDDDGGGGEAGGDVTVRLLSFRPAEVVVDAGDRVTWVQEDPGAHTVTSGSVEQGASGVTEKPDGSFASGELATGERFTFTFDDAGTYPYFCELHPATMRGTVRVR